MKHGLSIRRAASVAGVAVSTYYHWRRLYDTEGYRGLIPKSRRPRRVCTPGWSGALIDRFIALREAHPGEGARKIASYLRREGYQLSFAGADRLCRRLLQQRRIVPVRHWGTKSQRMHWSTPRRGKARPATYPGQVVAVDSLHVGIMPGVRCYFITFIDWYTRLIYCYITSSLTSHSAAVGLREAQRRFPFRICAVQTDGGAEFAGKFAAACVPPDTKCVERVPVHYVLPPQSPKLNAIVERVQGTIRQEFLRCTSFVSWKIVDIRRQFEEWLTHYSTVRPHVKLDYHTPQEVFDAYNASCHTPSWVSAAPVPICTDVTQPLAFCWSAQYNKAS